MKARLIALVAIAAIVAGGVAGCTGASATEAPPTDRAALTPAPGIAVTDALGRTVTFDKLPMRIAIAGKASFLVADAVFMFPEASARVVALAKATQGSVDFVSLIDPAYAAKTILDGNAGAEQVAGTKPDVVIAKSSSKSSLGDPLESVGLKVVYVDFETPAQYTRDIATLGSLFGDAPRAQQLVSYFSGQTKRVTDAVAGLGQAEQPDVLLLSYSSKNGSIAFQVPPIGYIQTLEAQQAGGNPVWKGAQLGSGWTTVTLEQVAAWNPDQIYVIAYFDDPAGVAAKLAADPGWQSLTAVKSKAVAGFPGDFYSWDEPDPRWALGLTWLATQVNPQLASKIDMAAEVRAFYATVYGLDQATFDAKIRPHVPAAFR
jgi:iron complex transport system substrate-binding protein